MIEFLRFVWCDLFHRKYWMKVGPSRMRRITIWSEHWCHKCKAERIDMQFRRDRLFRR